MLGSRCWRWAFLLASCFRHDCLPPPLFISICICISIDIDMGMALTLDAASAHLRPEGTPLDTLSQVSRRATRSVSREMPQKMQLT